MHFEKVSYSGFLANSIRCGIEEGEVNDAYDRIVIPKRQTERSAGYDFTTPYPIALGPGERITIPSGIKAVDMPKDSVLTVHVRSSIGIKKGLVLPNGTGIIDSDYANNPDTEGDIMIALWNTTDKEAFIDAGERVAQGVFLKYLITADDDAIGERKGGIGST